jgi:dihydrofolate synthase/folylpolyglutamate synthase
VQQVAYQLNITRPASKVITITGTNGKGSCVATLASIYLQAGYRVGAYTSPHLWNFTERIVINGVEVSEKDLCAVFLRIENARENISLTYFEFTTLAALLIFQDQNLDIAILEVGMGGRLDAVNIVDADVAVITTIDLDHQAWLGETREKIAYEKAGIMRAGFPVVCGRDMPSSVYEVAEAQHVPMYVLGKTFNVEIVNNSGFFRNFTWQFNKKILKNLPLNHLLVDNIALSLTVVELLNYYFPVNEEFIRSGLAKCRLPGRQQIVTEPLWQMFDVAHNVQGIKSLAATLRLHPCQGKTLAVFSMLQDKDIKSCVAEIAGHIDKWFVAGLEGERGLSAEEVSAAVAQETSSAVSTYSNINQAHQAACSEATANDRIIVFGSFYVVSSISKI